MLLRIIPLHASDPALMNQRRLALYGTRARQIPEDEVEKTIRKELRDLIPDVFGGELFFPIISSACIHAYSICRPAN